MKKLTVASIALIVLFAWALPVSAHIWQADGSITVLLHINPNDDPIAQQLADLWFEVTDTTNQFDTARCNCAVSIKEGDKMLLSAPITPWSGGPSIFNMSVPFTFPDPAVYVVTVTGSPTGTSTFQNFNLSYNVRVERNPAGEPSEGSRSEFWLIMTGLVILIGGALYLTYKEARKQWKENSSSSESS